MTLRACAECTTRFAPGICRCPQCGSFDHFEDGAQVGIALPDMSKDQLLAEAERLGVSVPSWATKDTIRGGILSVDTDVP